MLDRPLAHRVPQVGDSGLPSRWVSLPFSTVAMTPQPPWQLLQVLVILFLFALTWPPMPMGCVSGSAAACRMLCSRLRAGRSHGFQEETTIGTERQGGLVEQCGPLSAPGLTTIVHLCSIGVKLTWGKPAASQYTESQFDRESGSIYNLVT